MLLEKNIRPAMTITYYLLAAMLIVILGGCGTVDQTQKPGDESAALEIHEAEKLVRQGDYTKAAEMYWEEAQKVESPLQENFQLRAAELQIEAGNLPVAYQYLGLINEQKITFELIPRKRIAEATIAVHEERFNDVLTLLPESLVTRAPDYKLEILQLRASALAGIGDTLASLQIRVEISPLLEDPVIFAHNQNEIWRLLASAHENNLTSWAETDNVDLKGWVALAQTKRTAHTSIEQLNSAIDQWKQNYPGHPASENLLTSILEGYENYFVIPEKIALLLPMSGRYAKIAEVIYAGILSAREVQTDQHYVPELTLYDTGDDPNQVMHYYNRAVSEGAEFVIGPLKKDSVKLLAQETELPIPVLTLNYLDSNQNAPSNMFQFGLFPEDEARQVAERASLDEHFSAIVLTPIGEWGERLADAFQYRFEELGGINLNTQFYLPTETDFSVPLKVALQLDQSEKRYKQLRSVLGQNLEFEPRRRQDVDMIFLVASPRVARLLRPQINYYYATDLPVYSTSHVFSGIENITSDRDINGVIYCDIPWLLQPSHDHELIREILILESGETYQLLPRFAALGIDAYQLPRKLAELAALNYERFNGLTGSIKMLPGNKLYRELNWAKFIDGKPVLLPQHMSTSTQN